MECIMWLNDNSSLLLSAAGALSGLVIHRGYFIHGEWHVQAPNIVRYYGSVLMLFIAGRVYYHASPLLVWFDGLLLGFLAHLISLLSSIITYRVAFHRLTREGFPGPLAARITKLWHVWQARDSKNYLVLDKLHAKYGDFVRTGPSEITVFVPDAFDVIDGRHSVCTKAEWYDLLHPEQSLVSTRDKTVHNKRRKEWLYAFTNQGLVNHRAKTLKYLELLDGLIQSAARDPAAVVDLSDLLGWFSFDIMSDWTLSKTFEMLENESWHHIISGMRDARSLLGPFSPAPWMFQLGIHLLPRVGPIKGWHDMTCWCAAQMKKRLDGDRDISPEVPDLAYYLQERSASKDKQSKNSWLVGDSLIAIVAGSEPTASALAGIFSELVQHPENFDKLRSELATVSDLTDSRALATVPHLDAVINEAMRLHPAAMTGGARKTPDDTGIHINGVFIPPKTTIIAPRYTISRREDCFERGKEFFPERWTTRPEMLRNVNAFSPFGNGPHTCVGNNLALNTIRLVVARLVMKYTFRLAPGVSPRAFDEGSLDHFATLPGNLLVQVGLLEA
ncbi:Tryprostatin B 6-hydroxylase [Cytospora mali]|uniref:Tryprostatin B 6-hydroxylase n=1 Tax=Cytospora mali TaxID=578113 RepID=A0A194WAK7_CYTMA|nr:Tryprostatin B 6-hydroxylase [Valsa mali]